MNCVVCGKPLADGEQTCPRCGFPKVFFPGDYQEGLRTIQPEIEAHRANFLKQVQVGLVVYHWKAGPEQVALDRQEVMPIAACSQLSSEPLWLSQPFARIPGEARITLQLHIQDTHAPRDAEVSIANLPASELQQVGVSMDEQLNLTVHLRNAAGEQTRSQRLPLFL